MPPQSSENKTLNVSEIFYSVQGEGKYSGAAAVFVRLAGCSMGCAWCDTKYALETKRALTPRQILEEVEKYPAKTVILTGGEPAEQDILPLLEVLNKNNFEIHLETNGANDIDTSLIFCTTVSPKKNVNENMLKKADVIKLVIDGSLTEKQILDYKKYINNKTSFYLQPEGNKPENTKQCLKLIKENPQLKLSVQLHKLLNIK
jgi:organic radical activating enzyme